MKKKNRQIFYIDIDEDVSSIIERASLSKKDFLYLVIPRKASVFQSGINLKLLKSSFDKQKKEVTIVTTDQNGKHLAKKSGLKTMARIEVEPLEDSNSDEPADMAIRIRPIQARRNAFVKEEAPKRAREKKMSIGELVGKIRSAYQKKEEWGGDYYIKPGKKFLLMVISISSALFFLIGYIALPSATVYIKPKFDNIDYTTNIVLADKRKNQDALRRNKERYIASEEISTTTKQTKVFKTANKEFNGKNASGKIKIINTTNEDWELRGGTRFKSEDGIIFRMKSGAIAPARTKTESGDLIPGEIVVKVEADPFDIYQKPVGRRGNLPPAKFVLPALTKYNQRLVWGESSEAMKGGITDYRDIIKEEDIESAKKQIQDNLILMAREELRTYIDEVNKLNKTNLVLLDDPRYLKINLEELKISDDLEGSYQEKFEVFAQIKALGVAFDFDQLFSILKKELADRTHPNMKLREGSISPENLTYEIVEQDEGLGQIKMTATVVGIEEYAIDASTQAGIRFGNQIREKIVGLEVDQAENLVGNLPEVDVVKIKTWPIWINKIPRISERVKVDLME